MNELQSLLNCIHSIKPSTKTYYHNRTQYIFQSGTTGDGTFTSLLISSDCLLLDNPLMRKIPPLLCQTTRKRYSTYPFME